MTKTPTTTTNGVTVSQTTNIHGSQQGEGVPAWAWVLIGLGVVAIVLLAVVIANGRRRPPPPGTPGAPGVPGPPPEPPVPPPAL